jgi:hypothetical protein
MPINKGDVFGEKAKTAKGVKFHSGKYPYAEKFHNFLDLKGIRVSTFEKTLLQYNVPEQTVKTFLAGKHVPSSWLSHLVEDIYGIRFKHEDFEARIGI